MGKGAIAETRSDASGIGIRCRRSPPIANISDVPISVPAHPRAPAGRARTRGGSFLRLRPLGALGGGGDRNPRIEIWIHILRIPTCIPRIENTIWTCRSNSQFTCLWEDLQFYSKRSTPSITRNTLVRDSSLNTAITSKGLQFFKRSWISVFLDTEPLHLAVPPFYAFTRHLMLGVAVIPASATGHSDHSNHRNYYDDARK